MDCKRRFSLLVTVLALTATLCSAQVQTGTPPFGSFGGGPDVVNLANLNVHLNVPVFSRPGRGLPFNFYLTYDSSIWYPVTASGVTTWTANGTGWGGSEVNVGRVVPTLISSTGGTCGSLPHLGVTILFVYGWAYVDGFGTSHPFGATSTVTSNSCTGGSSTGFNGAQATDLSGYSLSVSGNTVVSLYSGDGNLINTSTGTIQDRNGNEITVSSGVFTDTLGTTALTVSGSPASLTVYYTYVAPSGGNAVYTVHYANYTLGTNFGFSTINEGKSSAAVPLVTSIVLPDGTQYSFTYEATSPTPSATACAPYTGTTCTTGRITQVNFPTGGTINYWYTAGNNGVLPDGSTATLNRQVVGDGTWIYAQAKNAGAATITTITDPSSAGNQTLIQFQRMYETERQVYQGPEASLILLHTWITCYNGNTANCPTTAIGLPITQRTVSDFYGTTGPFAEHNYIYNSAGGMSEQDDYDYGPSGPGALLRKVVVQFYSTAPLQNITAFRQAVTICNGTGTNTNCNGTGTPVSVTNYTYDQGTPITSTGVAQHVAVTTLRGNLTNIAFPAGGLTASFTYWDTGSPNTSQDVNGGTTIYSYSSNAASCQMAFPTKITEAISTLTQSYAWNCPGGVQLSTTDENGQVTSTTYSDPYFWRPASTKDQESNVTQFAYGTNPMSFQQQLLFNSNNSVAHTGLGFDGLGRPIFADHARSPSQTAWDAVQQSYDSNGRSWKTSAPCVSTGAWTCPTTSQTATYDALNRISQVTQVTNTGNRTTTYTYPQNDVLVTVSPAPGSENTKRRQLEYNSIGQLTSVCELTTMAGSGTCGQNSAQMGYWTTYTYDALGDLIKVTQNAQAAAINQQPRTYGYDAMGRLTSETNPESGTTTYGYDSVSGTNCTATSHGDLIKRSDANGNYICFNYDALHRVTDVGNNILGVANPCKRFRYDNTTGILGSIPSGVSSSYNFGRVAEAETDTCAWPVTPSSMITDEWFSYTPRGEISDTYESTPHSGAYYHSASTYWANGAMNQLTGYVGSTLNYSFGWNLDGEGRPLSDGLVSGATYNVVSQPTQVNFTWGDSDLYAYDPYTGSMTQYQFEVNSQTNTGALTWNPNGTLGSLNITDPFNPADTQTCNYAHDDLVRIASANCGSAASQTFSYDPFGNLNKVGSPFSFQPGYSTSTNRMTSLGSYTPTYDNDGNLLSDNLHSYTWDVYGNLASMPLDAVTTLTFDALDRMVEQNRSGAYTQFLYSPTGFKMEILNGSTVSRLFVPLAGGGTAVYNAGGLLAVRHPDWLGSSRFASTPSRTMYYDGAYAPFGDTYAQSGTTDLSFTGMNSDTASGVYDFLYRPYSSQGRWPSPDRAGLAAVDPTNPQSWNRYAYVANNPLGSIDPLGLCPKGQTCLTGVACRNPANASRCPNEPPGFFDLPWQNWYDEFQLGAITVVGYQCMFITDCSGVPGTSGALGWAPVFGPIAGLGGGGGGAGGGAAGCSQPSLLPHSGGIVAGGEVSLGAGVAGASAQSNGGIFLSTTGDMSLFGTNTAFANFGTKYIASTPQKDTPIALGGYAGIGVGLMLSNATNASQIREGFNQVTLSMPAVSASFSYAGGIWQINVTVGPGAGLAGTGSTSYTGLMSHSNPCGPEPYHGR